MYGHIFPFGGAFFVGAGVGYANVHGTIANHYTLTPTEYAVAMVEGYHGSSTLEIDSQANVRTLVLTPQIGLLKTFQAGFFDRRRCRSAGPDSAEPGGFLDGPYRLVCRPQWSRQ